MFILLRILLLIVVCKPELFGSGLSALDHATIGIYAVQCRTGDVYIDKNSDLSLFPGSCMKIATTAAALKLLGENHRFETHLEYDGYIDSEKTLHGNLYIKGGGDPCLGSDRISSSLSWERQVESWANAIQQLGIQRIEGKVIGDATKWEKALAVPSWNWEDLGNYYGAGACALTFHENSYTLFFKPGNSIGEEASIVRTVPSLPALQFHNEVKTGPEGSGDRACIYGCEFFPVQFVRGTIPMGVQEFAIRGAIPDPAAWCAELLAKELQNRGIAIEQHQLSHQGLRTSFHTTYSPTIKEIVYWTNQKSINLYAEHLLKKIGEAIGNDGSTASGVKAVTAFWESHDIDLSGMKMADASGLSRQNLVTAKQLAWMLAKIKKMDYFPLFFESLPQQEGLIRAKSGSMSGIKGYAGYCGDIAFAIIINNHLNHQIISEKVKMYFEELNRLNLTSSE